MSTVVLTDVDDARLEPFRHISDHHWLTNHGLFIVEGRLVVTRLLASPLHVRAVLVTESAHEALRSALAASDHPPVYLVPKAWMERLTGFNLHRGCLAVAERPSPQSVDDLLTARPRRLLVLERIGNPDNIGALFRNAFAFGVDGIVLGPACADPLYRKAVRVSSGASLTVPFAAAVEWPGVLDELRASGVAVLAMTPAADAMPIDSVRSTINVDRGVALLLGAEGDGLSAEAQSRADLRVRIPIASEADSLNVAVAAAIALHALGSARRT